MGSAPHGSLTVAPAGSRRRIAVAGGVMPGLWGAAGGSSVARVATATVGGRGVSPKRPRLGRGGRLGEASQPELDAALLPALRERFYLDKKLLSGIINTLREARACWNRKIRY
jgi:hypothetical protein